MQYEVLILLLLFRNTHIAILLRILYRLTRSLLRSPRFVTPVYPVLAAPDHLNLKKGLTGFMTLAFPQVNQCPDRKNLNKTLPMAQRTRGLGSTYQRNFFG